MKNFRLAFRQTIPVLCGYVFLGAAFGLLLRQAGYGAGWAFCISAFVYAGSLQFAMIGFLSGGISLFSAALMGLSINCRHIFYGVSFLEKFKKMGKLRPYMIFSLTDETYSLLCAAHGETEEDENWQYFFIALLNQLYWVAGTMLGSLAGGLIFFNTEGIDFAMTALFLVIFIEQWLGSKNHYPALVGLICGVLSLIFFGPNRFLLPALVCAAAALLWEDQHPVEQKP